jgi:hypothetical protein
MAPVDEWKPCEVLQGERWCPGYVERWRRDERGWRALVRYSEAPGMTYINWQPAENLRPRI